MARPRTISREHLLDAAQAALTDNGVTGLSFGSVATKAGVPKATVQSAFGSREAMIDALLGRWLNDEKSRFDAAVDEGASPSERVAAHIKITGQEPLQVSRRMATLLATLAGSGEQSQSTTDWYLSRIGDLEATTPEARHLRIAFLAAEGAFFLRNLAGLKIEEEQWADIFNDLEQMAKPAR